MSHEKQKLILDFWFGDDVLKPLSHQSLWFSKRAGVDDLIRSNFSGMLDEAAAGGFDDWVKTPRGALALVILLDQFPRNIYRGTDQAFAYDDDARRIAEIAIANGFDKELLTIERCFLYLPLEHSEDIVAQNRAVDLYQDLAANTHGSEAAAVKEALSYAIRHRDIIAKYGRFPHRNELIGRDSTKEEKEFLKRPQSSF
ncbi:MAG TPA: DUF924 family protein [Bdellovibrionales bacterium]|nr:DUF924 family protein [Bdellovibrionales bacterium]